MHRHWHRQQIIYFVFGTMALGFTVGLFWLSAIGIVGLILTAAQGEEFERQENEVSHLRSKLKQLEDLPNQRRSLEAPSYDDGDVDNDDGKEEGINVAGSVRHVRDREWEREAKIWRAVQALRKARGQERLRFAQFKRQLHDEWILDPSRPEESRSLDNGHQDT